MEGQEIIGIVGGGQLGRMLTLAAKPLGFRVAVLNPHADGPASKVGAEEIVGDLYDEKALSKLAKQSDHITIEIEHLNAETLEALGKTGAKVNPSPATISLIQDKFKQKEHLQKSGVPVAPFVLISNKESALHAFEKFGGAMLLKTRYGAYDGRGNMLVNSTDDINKAFETFKDQPLYAEGFVPFIRELAVMVARDIDGNVATYPLTQTIHERNICIETVTPAAVSDEVARRAEVIAGDVAALLSGAGVFGIEMFETESGDILVNEIAPRVHNSGHYTIEACRTSQFEQHMRVIAGLPLGDTDMVVPAAVMVNILGERDGPMEVKGLADALKIPGVSVHLYDKHPTKIDRKMGHITATGKTIDEARNRAEEARRLLSI